MSVVANVEAEEKKMGWGTGWNVEGKRAGTHFLIPTILILKLFVILIIIISILKVHDNTFLLLPFVNHSWFLSIEGSKSSNISSTLNTLIDNQFYTLTQMSKHKK